jgi:T5orf172 domain
MTYKIFYIFKDPMGANESKIGITGHPEIRLGTYQNSYSKTSHTACFDVAYYGPPTAIQNLEKAVKQVYSWHIERDGRGASEWVNERYDIIESKIDELINGYRFKIFKIPKNVLPLTVDNFTEVLNYIKDPA